MLDEGVAQRAADIDVIYLTGYGFPGFRGGPMFYADSVGLGEVHERVAALHREHGQRFEPAPLLARLAAGGLELPRARQSTRSGRGGAHASARRERSQGADEPVRVAAAWRPPCAAARAGSST